MILGTVSVIVGFILAFNADVQTTQYFSGWVFGAMCLSAGPGLKGAPRLGVTATGIVYVMMNPQTLVPKPKDIPCKNGEVRTANGVETCVCYPPYIGVECDTCAQGAIIESGSNENRDAVCSTCYYMYAFPYCRELLPGYASVDAPNHIALRCNERWTPSCYNEDFFVSDSMRTYDSFTPGIRKNFYNVDETTCMDDGGEVYCDKCADGNAGRYCCPDGRAGPNCNTVVNKCTDMLDYGATLKPDKFPEAYTLVEPEACFPLGDNACSCGGDFIGDLQCASNFCDGGLCASVARSASIEERCLCDVGVGPDCETPTCYGGTRAYDGAAKCVCTAKYSTLHETCNIEVDEKKCYPGLYGSQCQECQCAMRVDPDEGIDVCPKNIYGVFDRDFRTKEFTEQSKCVKSGTCKVEPDDCGDVVNGNSQCSLWQNPANFQTILFSGYKCNETKASTCFFGEPCTF